jgi:hypothetical protein
MHANAGASRLSAGPVHTTCAASIAEQGSSSVPPALLERSLQDMPPAKRASPPRRTMGRRKSVLRSNTSEQPPPPGDGSTLPAGHNELDQIVLTPSAMPPARRARTKPPKPPAAEPSPPGADALASPPQATPGGRLVGGLGRVVSGIMGMLSRPPRSQEHARPAGDAPRSRSPPTSESLPSTPAPRPSALRAGISSRSRRLFAPGGVSDDAIGDGSSAPPPTSPARSLVLAASTSVEQGTALGVTPPTAPLPRRPGPPPWTREPTLEELEGYLLYW